MDIHWLVEGLEGTKGMTPPASIAIADAALPHGEIRHLCWIARIVREGAGVRVFFTKEAQVRDGAEGIHAEPGTMLYPANSGHDGCDISIIRREGNIGARASAHFFAYGLMKEPQVTTEWISAEPATPAK